VLAQIFMPEMKFVYIFSHQGNHSIILILILKR